MPFLSHIATALFFALSGGGLFVGAGSLAKCAADSAKTLDSRPADRAGRLGARFCAKGENCEPEIEDNQGEENEGRQEFLKCANGGGIGLAASVAGANTECAPPRRLSPLNASDVRTRKQMREFIRESQTRQTLHADSARIPFTPDGAARNRMRREWNGADFQRTTGGANRDDLDELDEAGEYSTE